MVGDLRLYGHSTVLRLRLQMSLSVTGTLTQGTIGQVVTNVVRIPPNATSGLSQELHAGKRCFTSIMHWSSFRIGSRVFDRVPGGTPLITLEPGDDFGIVAKHLTSDWYQVVFITEEGREIGWVQANPSLTVCDEVLSVDDAGNILYVPPSYFDEMPCNIGKRRGSLYA